MSRLRILVSGFLGLLPAGGVAWDYVQYPVGLAELGHDVYYIEDTGLWPVYQTAVGDSTENMRYINAIAGEFGLSGRWAYRDEPTRRWFGLDETTVKELIRTADVFVNVSCASPMRDEYRAIPVRVLIDSDPMFTQIQHMSQESFTPGASSMRDLIAGHTHHFTFGENVGAADCRIPDCGVDWKPTRQPICLTRWHECPPVTGADAAYTTVMNWAAGPPLIYGNDTWGQKDIEFRRIIDLPSAVPDIPLAIAVGGLGGPQFPTKAVLNAGWQLIDSASSCGNWRLYRSFIEKSRGEFSVAKETYVKARTGWFSCRSACYLAAGRPVVAQDTGWSRQIPTGEGLFAFEDRDEAAQALRRVAADPERHSRAARLIAEEFFDSRVVLTNLIESL